MCNCGANSESTGHTTSLHTMSHNQYGVRQTEQVDAFDIGEGLSGDPGPPVHAGVAVAFTYTRRG
jgi:hypothetical protein